MSKLTIRELQIRCTTRLHDFKQAQSWYESALKAFVEHAGPSPRIVKYWSLTDWMTALTGEVGEAANIIKKMRRGDMSLSSSNDRDWLADELADIMCYLVLVAERADIDLEQAVIKKYNEVSARINSVSRLKR